MPRKYATGIDLSKNELIQARIQNLTSAPSSPGLGQIYFDTANDIDFVYTSTGWKQRGIGAGSGNVSKAVNSAIANTLQVSGGADKSIADWSAGSNGLVKTTAAGVLSVATAGTDYVTANSTNSLTNKSFDAAGTGNSLSNLATSHFASGVIQPSVNSGSTNLQLPTAQAVYSAIQAAFGANDAMVIKGGIDASTNPNFPAANAGDTYRITVAGKIGGTSGATVEVGDMIICFVDSTAAGTLAAVGANWIIEQSNLNQASTAAVGYTRYATAVEVAARSAVSAAVTPDALTAYPQKYATTVGDGTNTSFVITHNLGSRDGVVSLYDASNYAVVECDVVMTTTNSITLGFSVAPALNAYRVVVVG